VVYSGIQLYIVVVCALVQLQVKRVRAAAPALRVSLAASGLVSSNARGLVSRKACCGTGAAGFVSG
jgi:hypothetical protein